MRLLIHEEYKKIQKHERGKKKEERKTIEMK